MRRNKAFFSDSTHSSCEMILCLPKNMTVNQLPDISYQCLSASGGGRGGEMQKACLNYM